MSKNILAIGTSGLGKTTLCRLLCDGNVNGSDGSESATEEVVIHEGNGFRYIDTPGLDDSHGKTDEDIFCEILRKFQNNSTDNRFQVDIILWFCEDNVRELNHFQRAAKFIQRFIEYTDYDYSENLWNSVLIVFKSVNSVSGPKSAAKKVCQSFSQKKNITFNDDRFSVDNFPCLIYDLDKNSKDYKFWGKHTPEDRKMYNVYCQHEVRSELIRLISNRKPIHICFVQARCRKCNAKGDPRLFDGLCHENPILNHQIEDIIYHHRDFGYYHSEASILEHEPDLSFVENLQETQAGNVIETVGSVAKVAGSVASVAGSVISAGSVAGVGNVANSGTVESGLLATASTILLNFGMRVKEQISSSAMVIGVSSIAVASALAGYYAYDKLNE
ncbi:14691_t:CDS:1, partial [Acaulospora colombiana]